MSRQPSQPRWLAVIAVAAATWSVVGVQAAGVQDLGGVLAAIPDCSTYFEYLQVSKLEGQR